ncbi:MAG: acetyl-CoA carboxylase, carboxyltransferase subunit beta [Gammaproteobacteria bacterium]|nr:acetyl-CoA carboxylase, carboxyltransferase subunit beta [Gammaproteobacteria bacterium]
MNWLTNFVRPKFRALVKQNEPPDNLWFKCPNCGQMIFHRDLEENLFVCQHCSHHLRVEVKKRLEMLFDDGQYNRIELPAAVTDPLKFKDLKRYTDRLKESRAKTGEEDAIIVAHGKMGGHKVVIAAFDFSFMGGSMGVAVGEGLVSAAKLAVLQDAPLIVVPASGGARMQEGILSLMQLPRTVIAVEEVREANLPYIVLLTDPTTGGVTASFAMLGDIHVAEPGALIGFAGQRVIEQTVREKLPEGFQRAEYLKDHGIVDIVVPRHELRDTLVNLIDLLRNRTPDAEIVPLPVEGEILPPEGGDDLAEAAARAAGRAAATGSRDTGQDK